ncbi:Protein TusB [invertebrate metagenome]|uniref:Protein TusB n=1 Tax=invertebrate metagenome TaxID=1711999 RepID=A0A2H9T6P2_9ZZZZ
MNTLHIVNKPGSPLALCQRAILPDDGILFIEDGVYCIKENLDDMKNLTQEQSIYCLKTDCQARGIVTIHPHISVIDYDIFVTLSCQYDQVISWF